MRGFFVYGSGSAWPYLHFNIGFSSIITDSSRCFILLFLSLEVITVFIFCWEQVVAVESYSSSPNIYASEVPCSRKHRRSEPFESLINRHCDFGKSAMQRCLIICLITIAYLQIKLLALLETKSMPITRMRVGFTRIGNRHS